MPVIGIQVPLETLQALNYSLQVGDTIYYVPLSELGGFDIGDNINELGPYLGQGAITYNGNPYPLLDEEGQQGSFQGIWVLIENGIPLPELGDFLLFSKDNIANENGLLGYYMSVKIENDSDDYAELFSVGTEVFESSK